MNSGSLDKPTGVHDVHTFTHPCDDAEIVCNENNCCTELRLHLLDYLENLRLHRDIKRRGGFVSDQQFRAIGNCHSDNYTLSHTTRKLVGVLHCAVAWLWNSHDLQEFNSPCTCSTLAHGLMSTKHLGNLCTNPMHGIQCR